jgi:hypothetical protein
MGRGWEHFWAEGTRLEPNAPQPGEAEWRGRAIELVERADPQQDVAPSAQTSLFD